MKEINIGSAYNNFTVISLSDKKAGNGQPLYICRCICGEKREVRKDNLGTVKGCGCIRSTYRPRMLAAKQSKKTKPVKVSKNDGEEIECKPSVRRSIEDILLKKQLKESFEL